MTRQDFSETLYLNISIVAFGKTDPDDPQANGGIYKLTVNTTAGYFELPNYMNGQQAGPLVEGNPNDYCGLDCAPRGYDNASLYDHNVTERSTSAMINNETWTALSLDAVANKGVRQKWGSMPSDVLVLTHYPNFAALANRRNGTIRRLLIHSKSSQQSTSLYQQYVRSKSFKRHVYRASTICWSPVFAR